MVRMVTGNSGCLVCNERLGSELLTLSLLEFEVTDFDLSLSHVKCPVLPSEGGSSLLYVPCRGCF